MVRNHGRWTLLSCEQVLQELSEYLDGELDPWLKMRLKIHLKMCRNCRIVFNTTEKTVELYCDDKLFELPAPIRTRLHESLRRKWEQENKLK